MKRLLIFLLCMLPFSALAQQQLMTANKNGKLEIHIMLADNPDFIKQWFQTPPADAPKLKGTHTAVVDRRMTCAFILNGLKVDDKHHYEGIVSVKVIKPDGTVLFEQNDYAGVKATAPDRYKDFLGAYVMADPALDVVMEKKDDKGKYHIEAIVKDKNSDKTATDSYEFTLE